MDIHFVDPSMKPVPPQQVKVDRLDVEPYPDGRRIAVSLELTPFQERPTLELTVVDEQGGQLAQTTIIETVDHELELTMHLPPAFSGTAAVVLEVAFEEHGTVDRAETRFKTG